jgi:hypothetical protein
MPGAAFASGPAVNVSDDTFGQARSKAAAVEGDSSVVIELSDNHDRRIGMRLRVVARLETKLARNSHAAHGLQALVHIGNAIINRPPLDRRMRCSRTYTYRLQSGRTYPNLHSASCTTTKASTRGMLRGTHPFLLLTGRTAAGFSLVSWTSCFSWRNTRSSPSRSVYSTFSTPISTSNIRPR